MISSSCVTNGHGTKVWLPGIHVPGRQAQMARPGAGRLQAPRRATDRQKLGRIDGVAAVQAAAVRAGMDGVLRHQRVLPAHSGTGRMDSTAHPDVLLETVALAAYQDSPPAGTRGGFTFGNPARRQQQELLGHGEDAGNPAGHVERLAEGTGIGQCA